MQLNLMPDEDRVLAAIHPMGTEYITTPHASGPLQRHRFGDDVVIGRIDPPEGVHWDFVAGYLDSNRIVASTNTDGDEGQIVLN